ncbi:MAG: hypothetical protein WD557_16215 [Dehalococcoidia bacterium]
MPPTSSNSAPASSRQDEIEAKYDSQFPVGFDALRELISAPPAPGRELGFKTRSGEAAAG